MDPVAAFILAGGQSSRMGADKALLPGPDGVPLLLRIAAILQTITPIVHVIASPDLYGHLGLPVTPDLRPGQGPLAGIETALSLDLAEWNLILACDMPNLQADPLIGLIRQSFTSQSDCILSINPSGRPEPLCSLYRRTALPAIRDSLDRGVRKVTSALEGLQVAHFAIDNQEVITNLNTPQEWREHLANRRG